MRGWGVGRVLRVLVSLDGSLSFLRGVSLLSWAGIGRGLGGGWESCIHESIRIMQKLQQHVFRKTHRCIPFVFLSTHRLFPPSSNEYIFAATKKKQWQLENWKHCCFNPSS